MSRNSWIALIIALVLLCMISAVAVPAAYVAYHALTRPTTETSSAQPSPARPNAPGASGAEASSGGTLRLAGALPPTLDPAMAQDTTSAEYIVHLFSGLVGLDSDLEVIPGLASGWDTSEDGRTYTFRLLPGAVFGDGKRITSEDIIYSLERACAPTLGSPVAASYLGDIVGVDEMIAGQAEHISGLRAVDEHTIEITIDAPKAYFLAKLTYPTAFVVDRAQIEREGDSWMLHPNGSGPFVLESIDRDRMVLTRNPNYYRQPAKLYRVEYLFTAGVPITMYENDELDIVGVSPAEIERVQDPSNPLHNELYINPELSVSYLGLNVTLPPFDDPLVRQAFAYALDKRKIADLVLNGTSLPADQILPPVLPDYDNEFEGIPYDPAKAQTLLAASRYGGADAMPEVVLSISGVSGFMDGMTQAIVAMLEESLGIDVMVEQVDWSDFLDDMNRNRYQLFSAGWFGDYPDSQNFLDLLFHSGSAQNHMGYSNPEVDLLLKQARTELDPQQRTDLYRQAQRLIVMDASWIPLTHGIDFTLVKPHVAGYQTNAVMYPWLKEVYLTD